MSKHDSTRPSLLNFSMGWGDTRLVEILLEIRNLRILRLVLELDPVLLVVEAVRTVRDLRAHLLSVFVDPGIRGGTVVARAVPLADPGLGFVRQKLGHGVASVEVRLA
jgi:hypothetical protein